MDTEGETGEVLIFPPHPHSSPQVKLFEQDIVLLPIHLGMHWCLAVIDFSQKELVYYDSLSGNNHSCVDRLRSADSSHLWLQSDWSDSFMQGVPERGVHG